MSTAAPLQNTAANSPLVGKSPHAGLLLQRKCACGGSASSSLSGECGECNKKRLQKKLSIGASNDPLEQEADRIADQVLAGSANSKVSKVPPRIQRFTGQSSREVDTVPVSVDRVLAGSGSPLDTALQQDMGQRFGHDFSQVRVHTGLAAEQSARDVHAHAYTVGHNIVFGAGGFAPRSHEGRKLLAHELTHVVQMEQAPTQIKRKIRSDPQASLNKFLSGKGVQHYTESNSVYERPKGGAVNFEQEILIDMLASPRIFNIEGGSDSVAASNLNNHLKARIGIVFFAGQKKYNFAALAGWSMNPNYYEWDVNKGTWKMKPDVNRQEAWDDLNVNAKLYAIGCAAATDLTMKGGSKGADIIDKPSSDINDWVPGEAGYIENTNYPPGGGIGVLGENLIYTGNGKFWGHLPGTDTYRTLPEWIKEVHSWHQGAKVLEKRELPATGLMDK